jgi:membrane protein
LRWSVGLLLLFSGLALTYRFGPSVRTRLHLFSPGSCFAVAMWILTAWGFRYYIGVLGAADTYARTYGAVAGVAFLMLLFYLDALFLLIGAEINAEIDFIRLGIKSGELPAEQEVAPVPPYQLDEEDRELKAELEERRSVDIPGEQAAQRKTL